MNKKSFGHKRQHITNEKRLEKFHYRILVTLIVIGVLYHYLFDPTIIGHDNRYMLYVLLLPMITGMLGLAYYRKDFLLQKLRAFDKFWIKSFAVAFYLTQGMLFSYFSLGLTGKIVFNYVNNLKANGSKTETINCEITNFWTGRQPHIDFIFENRFERFSVNSQTIKALELKNPTAYTLELTARKGLWNYYIIDRWEVKSKH